MNNLQELWTEVKGNFRPIEKKYNVKLLNIGVNGTSRFRVNKEDLKKKFGGPLIDLVSSKEKQEKEYSATIKIYESAKDHMSFKPWYVINIYHEEGASEVEVSGTETRPAEEKDLRKFYTIPKGGMLLLESWDDIINGFDLLGTEQDCE